MDNPYPTIISFYTGTWLYPNYATKMKVACRGMGLESHIVYYKDTGEWLSNTRLKPQFIYDTIQELKRPVLWIDVDGSIMKVPELLKEGYSFDFAAKEMGKHRERIWQVGTMYFNYTPASLAFLKEWSRRVKTDRWSDELSLDEMWKERGEEVRNLRADDLPKEYFQMLRGDQSSPLRNSVICHRASKGDSKMVFMKKVRAKKADLGTGI